MRRAALLLLIALAACAGGTEDSDSLPDTVEEITTSIPPEGRALADWREAANAICRVSFPRITTAANAIGTPQSSEELVVRLDPFIEAVFAAYDALIAIPVPTERTREVKQLHDRLERGKQALTAVRAEAVRGDFSSYLEAVGHFDNYADAGEIFEALDVVGCSL